MHILIDGRRTASICPGAKVEIPLPPGRHQVRARVGIAGSQPVEIDAGSGEVYYLKVGSNPAAWKRWWLVLSVIAPFAILFISIESGHLFKDPIESGWFGQFMIPMVWLPFLVQLPFVFILRDHVLALEDFPTPDPAARRVELPQAEPLRVRITIQMMMIAVAVLAVLLGAAIHWARCTRRDYFRAKARQHAHFESMFRQNERDLILMGGGREVGRSAARANFHAAMKRKYDEAASRGAFSVEPDSPAPPLP